MFKVMTNISLGQNFVNFKNSGINAIQNSSPLPALSGDTSKKDRIHLSFKQKIQELNEEQIVQYRKIQKDFTNNNPVKRVNTLKSSCYKLPPSYELDAIIIDRLDDEAKEVKREAALQMSYLSNTEKAISVIDEHINLRIRNNNIDLEFAKNLISYAYKLKDTENGAILWKTILNHKNPDIRKLATAVEVAAM